VKRDRIVQIRVTDDEYGVLSEMAAELDMTRSEVLRRPIKRFARRKAVGTG